MIATCFVEKNLIKTYKPNEVVCVINDEKCEGLSPEAIEWLVKKKECLHFWCHSHCGRYKKCIKCDELAKLETNGGVFDIDYLVELTKEPSYTMPQGLTREQIIEWARGILEKDDENSN